MKILTKIYLCDDNSEKIFGYGPLILLREVEKTGSLRKASVNMNMAYTKALKLIKNAEDGLGFKCINSSAGGKGGGGSTLTKEILEFMEKYEEYSRDCADYSRKRFSEIFTQTK